MRASPFPVGTDAPKLNRIASIRRARMPTRLLILRREGYTDSDSWFRRRTHPWQPNRANSPAEAEKIVLGSGISSVVQPGFALPRLMDRADIAPETSATTPFPLPSRASVPARMKIEGVAPMTLVTEIVSQPVVAGIPMLVAA
jgi:hypothetical protein